MMRIIPPARIAGVYDPAELLARIDDHTAPILIGFGIAMAFQTVWLVDAILTARRDKVYSLPLFCTFFWFAHDVGCVVRFDDWFNGYDHWYLKFFWLGLLSAMLLELVFFYQAFKYGRDELLPMVSERAWAGVLAVGALGGIVTWELLKTVYDDPLYQQSPALTLVTYPLFAGALMIRRRSALGQSVRMWQGACGITLFWWITTVAFFGDGFDSWQYVAAGVFALTCDVAGLVAVTRLSASARPAEDRVLVGAADPG
jgi:hypothetical protein